MIRDAVALAEARTGWTTVRYTQSMFLTHLAAPLVPFGFVRTPDFDKACLSILVVNGFAVLEEVLEQLRCEAVFASPRRTLSELMNNSRSILRWKDFAAVDGARVQRNRVAHDRHFLEPKACAEILDVIEVELIGWGILDGPVRGTYGISIGRL